MDDNKQMYAEDGQVAPPTLEQLIEWNEEELSDYHADHYMGTDDDMPESYERWLSDLEEEDILRIIKRTDFAVEDALRDLAKQQ